MNLDPHARRYYRLEIDVVPGAFAPTEWEASFDDGVTWVRAISVEGLPAWLIAGPLVPAAAPAVAVIPLGSTTPRVRLIADNEIEVREAPTINVFAA